MTAAVTLALDPDGTWAPVVIAATAITQGGRPVVAIDGQPWVVREVGT